jgi:hypothetical protein
LAVALVVCFVPFTLFMMLEYFAKYKAAHKTRASTYSQKRKA